MSEETHTSEYTYEMAPEPARFATKLISTVAVAGHDLECGCVDLLIMDVANERTYQVDHVHTHTPDGEEITKEALAALVVYALRAPFN